MNEELKVVVTADTGDLEKGMNDAEKAVKEFADEADGAKGKIKQFFKDGIKDAEGFKAGIQKAGEISTNFLKVTAGAVAGVATALVALGPATAEYRTEMAKLETAFMSAGSNAEVAKTTYNDLYRVLGDSGQATEAAGHLAMLTQEEQALSEWTNICQGVYATFGDSLPIEGLTEAANETAKVGQLTGSLADALNWAGVNEEEFQAKLDACNTEAEREALIRETLNGLYSDAASTYEKNAAGILAQNEANAKMTEAMAKLGEVVAPVMAMLTELGAEILADLTPHIKQFADNHLPKIKKALQDVGDKIGVVINWIADHWQLVSTLAAVLIGIATAISLVSAGLTAYNTVMAITSVVSAPVIGIIAAIVAGIALLVAGIVLAVKHWDEITAAVSNFATKVGEFFSGLWDKITDWISNIGESISNWWSNTMQGFKDWWTGIQQGWSDFWSGVGQKITDGVQAAKDKFNDMKENIKNKVNDIKTNVSNKFQEIKNTLSDKVEEAKKSVTEKYNAMKDTMGTVMEAARNTVKQKLDNIKNAYEENGGGVKGIAAATMEAVKGYYSAGYTFIDNLTGGKLTAIKNSFTNAMSGVKTAVTNSLDAVKTKFSNIMENAKTIVSNALEKIKSFFKFEWSLPKIKLPHFSISGKFSLDPPSIPKISVSWYQKGGVFDYPTLFGYGNGSVGGLGENGAEAIVPLEKNTYWLDKIADRLAARQGDTPIVLTVDGKVFAQTSIDSINRLTKQTGSLGLVLG